jgi:hypothetical protein
MLQGRYMIEHVAYLLYLDGKDCSEIVGLLIVFPLLVVSFFFVCYSGCQLSIRIFYHHIILNLILPG